MFADKVTTNAPGITKMSMLNLSNVGKRFPSKDGEVIAVDSFDLDIGAGEFVTLIGPSGCGKSTLFNIIAGLIPPDKGGAIHLNGELQKHGDLLGKISFMPQRHLLFPWRTVLDNATLALEVEGVSRREARKRAEPMFTEFGLDGFQSKFPHELSGGMRQRVALMRTFLFERPILLLDEPFGALDALTRIMMQKWLLNIWEKHKRTVLFITHDIDEAIFMGDRVVVMSARPGTVKSSETISIPRPRESEVITSPEFMELKRRLLASVEEESMKTFEAAV